MAQHLLGKAKEFVADKVAHVKKPEADLSDVSVKHVGRDAVTLSGQLDVSNPYDHSIPICEISYSLLSAGREIASGRIAGKETTRLDIPLKVPYDFMVSPMKDVGRDWDLDYEMQVGLTVDLPVVGNLTLPLSKKGELKLPTLGDLTKRTIATPAAASLGCHCLAVWPSNAKEFTYRRVALDKTRTSVPFPVFFVRKVRTSRHRNTCRHFELCPHHRSTTCSSLRDEDIGATISISICRDLSRSRRSRPTIEGHGELELRTDDWLWQSSSEIAAVR